MSKHILTTIIVLAGLACVELYAGEGASPAVNVEIENAKPVVVRPVLPAGSKVHVRLAWGAAMAFSLYVDNKRLVYSASGGIRTTFKIDGRIVNAGTAPGRLIKNRVPLPVKASRPNRHEWESVYEFEKLRFTQIVQIVPSHLPPGKKAKPGSKRRLDTVLVRFIIENKDNRSHQIGLRQAMDMLLVNNDGCLFAAPNQPGKILNGVEIKDKQMPDFLQVLQIPNLKNPGYVSHFTFNLGRGRVAPNRVVLTAHGQEYTPWDVRAMRIQGDSGMAIFWDPQEVKAGTKVEFAYAYGEGLARPPESEGRVGVRFAGSFEPGKLFTIQALVGDPQPGQSLRLSLPPGMKLVEGALLRPVPPSSPNGYSIVMWRAKVREFGRHEIQIQSSTGVTQKRIVTVSERTAAK